VPPDEPARQARRRRAVRPLLDAAPVSLDDGVVALRPTTDADASDIAAAVPAGEPAVWEATSGPYTNEQARGIVRGWERSRRRGERLSLTVRRAADARFLGALVLQAGTPGHPVDVSHGDEVELAYWIARSERGRGYAGRAATLAVDWLLGLPGLKAVWAEIEAGNEASRRVAEAAGLVLEGEVEREQGPMLVYRRSA
jgi:RimJ/RimL family protein N-acetyltransferase